MERSPVLGPATTVSVTVTGSMKVPLHLDTLHTLDDAALQEEIMREAVRLTLAENLGGFDNITVTSSRKKGQPACEAQLDLADLCALIANAKRTYEYGQQQLVGLRDLIATIHEQLKEGEATGSADMKDITVPAVLKALGELVEEAMRGPGEAPFAVAISNANRSDTKGEVDVVSSDSCGAEGSDGDIHTRNPKNEGYEQLPDSDETSES
uniref:Uncharacterized protein n=1 Tax=Trypanosoma congolense (strain IL3000) TaxID=1068625 RepID=G0UVA6_TRYCI|nr:conserved hypothetical protein [Trypanosoma congolense IL3000]